MPPKDPDRTRDLPEEPTAGLSALPTQADAGKLAPTDGLAAGTRIGQFTIQKRLGAGGMGEVYAARDERLGRTVALKAIRAEWRRVPSVRARFIREAKLLSSLEHPNICRLYDYLESPEGDFLVLELIDGEPLSRAKLSGRAQRLEVAEGVTRALAAAHAAGVVHRDLKPDNVMLTKSGLVKVLDFGIARPAGEAEEGGDDASLGAAGDTTHSLLVTRQGGVVGTPMYMSPEQARGEDLGPASDIYSLGLLVGELFSGRSPRAKTSTIDELIEQAGRGERAQAGRIDRDVGGLVGRMTSRDPVGRPSASEVLRGLARCRRRPLRRAVTGAGAVVVLLAVLGTTKYVVDLNAEVARTQQALQASDRLVVTVLDDFGEALLDAGRLDLIEQVAARVEEHFADREPSALGANDRVRLARALGFAGRAALDRGEREVAGDKFGRALAMLEGVLAAEPDNSYALTEYGAAEFYVGSIAFGGGDYDTAAEHFNRYLESSRRLRQLSPEDPAAAFEVAQALTNLYAVYDRAGERDRAFAALEESLQIKRELVESKGEERDEDWRRWSESLANGLSYLAEGRDARGDLAGAIEAAGEESEVLSPVLEAFPGNASVRFIQATALSTLGSLLSRAGEHESALERFRSMYRVTEQLLEIDRENTRAARERAIAFQMIARECVALGRLDEAEAALAESRVQLDALLATSPGSIRWNLDLIDAERGVAAIALERDDGAVASEAAARLRGLLEGLAERGRGIRDFELRMARLEILEGRLAARGGDVVGATGLWEAALARVTAVGDPAGDPGLAEPAATVLLFLGEIDRARPLVEMMRGQGRQTHALEQLSARHGL